MLSRFLVEGHKEWIRGAPCQRLCRLQQRVMGNDTVSNLPDNCISRDLVAGDCAAVFTNLQQSGYAKQFKELSDDRGEVVPRHGDSWKEPVGLPL